MSKSCPMHSRMAHHPEEFKKLLKNRLSRIEGQIRGINRMVNEDVYCDDILVQISAIQAGLTAVATKLLEAHLKSCVVEQIQEGKLDVIDELMLTLQKLMKTMK